MPETRTIDGPTLRRYRRALGVRQVDLADRLGITQAAISLVESGRMPISDELRQAIWSTFDKKGVKLRLGVFLDEQQDADDAEVPLVSVTLPVVPWSPKVELGDTSQTVVPADLVTLRLPVGMRGVALSMKERSSLWVRDEILVFAFCGVDQCKPGNLCVLEPAPKRRGAASLIARVVRPKGANYTARYFELVRPEGTAIALTADAVRTVAKCVYRAKYIKTKSAP